MEDICLVDCDICEDQTSDLSSGHFVILSDGCLYDKECLFDVKANICVSKESNILTWSDLISSSIILIVAPISDFSAAISCQICY